MGTSNALDEAISLAQKWSQPHFWNYLFKYRQDLLRAREQEAAKHDSLRSHLQDAGRFRATRCGQSHDHIGPDDDGILIVCDEAHYRKQLHDQRRYREMIEANLAEYDDHTRLPQLVDANWPILLRRIPWPPQWGTEPTEGYTVATLAASVMSVYGELREMARDKGGDEKDDRDTTPLQADGPYEEGRFRSGKGQVVQLSLVKWLVLKSLWGKGKRDGRIVWGEVRKQLKSQDKKCADYTRTLLQKHCTQLQNTIQERYPQVEVGPASRG